MIDRRNEAAQYFLLRLANPEVQFLATVVDGPTGLHGCPAPDSTPLEVAGTRLKWIWRSARLAAIESEDASEELERKLVEKGIELVRLPGDESSRSEAVARLAVLLGGKAE